MEITTDKENQNMVAKSRNMEPHVSIDGLSSFQSFSFQTKIPIQLTVELTITPQLPVLSTIKSNGSANQEMQTEVIADIFEAYDYSGREGYNEKFLGVDEKYLVPLPNLSSFLQRDVAKLNDDSDNERKFELKYQHFSVIMNKVRRMPFLTAVNIDGNQLRRIPRGNDKWYIDSRIDRKYQLGNEIYARNDLDRGHMVRRLDPVWGENAAIANEDTFHYTNACPQHKDLNQKTWNDLEDYILDNAGAHDFKVSVFTGPVFRQDDIYYRGARIPQEFWKVVVIVDEQTLELSATAYLLSQADMIGTLEFKYGQFRTYQVPVSKIEALTDLDFGDLKDFDPLGISTMGKQNFKNIQQLKDIVFR